MGRTKVKAGWQGGKRLPRVGVGCIVFVDGKILLVKRKYPPQKGKWSIPGGHVEPGESIIETAVRELEEETGLKGKPLGVINIDEYMVRDYDGEISSHYVLVDVLIKVEGKAKPKPGSDAEDARFFTLEEALKTASLAKTTKVLLEKLSKSSWYCLMHPQMTVIYEIP